MPKQYYFESGNFQDLSFAELVSVFNTFGLNKDTIHRYSNNILLVKSNDISEEVLKKVFNRLGGFIRFGYIIEDLDTFLNDFSKKEDKVIFGLSILGNPESTDSRFLRKLGKQIKVGLKEVGRPSRFVNPLSRSSALNSAQIVGNSILEKGFELCIIRTENEEIYGSTISVQDVDGFAKRDMDKPHTDLEMGTLPPKLARIMVNLTGRKDGIVWDPFCGSGTILMEAGILGFDLLGSDIDEKAIEYTEKNIEWLSGIGEIGDVKYKVFQMDVTNPPARIVSDLKKTEVKCVVCEPYMGPPQRRVLFPNRADVYLERVKALYLGLIDILNRFAHEGFVVVVIIPSYKTHTGWKTFSIRDIFDKRWDVVNNELCKGRDLMWKRKNSIITRNIFVLRRR